jgi:zinc transport system ATP-binding protein
VEGNKVTGGDVLIRIQDAALGYRGRAVVGVTDLTLRRGHCLGVFGHNGSGKTTLVRSLIGLLPPVRGRVERPAVRPLRVGYLAQSRSMNLAWPMSGFDAAALAVSAQEPVGRLGRAATRRIEQAMASLDVLPLGRQSFATLSGGQQQRLLLAGALAAEPDVLVLDEPTDGLDAASCRTLLLMLRELKSDGLCVVLISHDLEDLLAVADEVAWLRAAQASGPSVVECHETAQWVDRLLHAGKAG